MFLPLAWTVFVVLALAVLVLGKLIVDLANNPWLNLGLGVVLLITVTLAKQFTSQHPGWSPQQLPLWSQAASSSAGLPFSANRNCVLNMPSRGLASHRT